MAAIVDMGVNCNRRRPVPGMDIACSDRDLLDLLPSQNGAAWSLASAMRALNPVPKVLAATWRFMSKALAYSGRGGRCLAWAFIATGFAQDNVAAARQR